jgi:hypothetical protein
VALAICFQRAAGSVVLEGLRGRSSRGDETAYIDGYSFSFRGFFCADVFATDQGQWCVVWRPSSVFMFSWVELLLART